MDATVKVLVLTPQLPRFVRTERGPIKIEELSDDTLREIGAEWTNALVAKAQSLRLP